MLYTISKQPGASQAQVPFHEERYVVSRSTWHVISNLLPSAMQTKERVTSEAVPAFCAMTSFLLGRRRTEPDAFLGLCSRLMDSSFQVR